MQLNGAAGWAHPAYLQLTAGDMCAAQLRYVPHVQLAFVSGPGIWHPFVFGPSLSHSN